MIIKFAQKSIIMFTNNYRTMLRIVLFPMTDYYAYVDIADMFHVDTANTLPCPMPRGLLRMSAFLCCLISSTSLLHSVDEYVP